MSSTTSQSDNVPENYKDARATPDVADWMKACDVEMGKLRSFGCWEVLPRSSLPHNASIMTSRWTFRYKINELGNLKSVSHRSRFVAKGYFQVQGLHFFENHAPGASFIKLRLLFALTSIPNFQVLQYDVSIAFIQSKLDSNHPPVYCECAEGYEDRRKYIYRLHRHLRHERQSSMMGSTIRKRLHRLRTYTPQKRRMCLRKICQQFKDPNPKCATKPGKYYRSHCSRTRKRQDLFGLSACYSDTNYRQLRR